MEKKEVTPAQDVVSVQKLQDELNQLVLQRQDHESGLEKRMIHLEMDMKREKEKNGDLLRQYNRLELAYQSTQDRFKKLQLHLDQLGRIGDRVLILESQIMDLGQRFKNMLTKQESAKGSIPMIEKEILSIRRSLENQNIITLKPLAGSDSFKKSDVPPYIEQSYSSQTQPEQVPQGDVMQNKIDNVFFPQSSILKPNCELEPLDNIWAQPKSADTVKNSKSVTKSIESIALKQTDKTQAEAKPSLPAKLTAQLDFWLKNRRSWNHQDWLDLLKNLSELGFEQQTRPENQEVIGHYLETHRSN